MPQPEGRARRRRRLGREAPETDAAEHRGARPVWSGSLTFGLVSVPVELYSAQRRDAVSLRMLGPDGVPLARRYVCSADGTPLGADEIVRGYEVAKGRFVVVTDEELEALAPRRSRDIEITRFVERREIDPAYFVRGYFLVPTGEQTKAYRLLADLLEAKGRAAIARFVMREKAYAVAVFAEAGVLRAETLRFADELRSAEALGLPEAAKTDRARVRKMEQALEGLERAELDPDELRDEAEERLLALARRKRVRDEDVVEPPEAPPAAEEAGAEVVDLLALLRQRMGRRAGGSEKGPRKLAKRAGARKRGASSASRRPRRAHRG